MTDADDRDGGDEFLVHETLLGAGEDLVVVRWPRALQRLSLWTRVSTATRQHQTLCHTESSNGGHQWTTSRYATAEDGARNIAADTVYRPQSAHPHAFFSVDGRWVVFSSDRTGHPEEYVAEVPPNFPA